MLNLISGAVLAGSTNVGEFIAFRFIAGAGAFSILAAVPVSATTLQDTLSSEADQQQIWMNEVVPQHLRGGIYVTTLSHIAS